MQNDVRERRIPLKSRYVIWHVKTTLCVRWDAYCFILCLFSYFLHFIFNYSIHHTTILKNINVVNVSLYPDGNAQTGSIHNSFLNVTFHSAVIMAKVAIVWIVTFFRKVLGKKLLIHCVCDVVKALECNPRSSFLFLAT